MLMGTRVGETSCLLNGGRAALRGDLRGCVILVLGREEGELEIAGDVVVDHAPKISTRLLSVNRSCVCGVRPSLHSAVDLSRSMSR